MNEQEKKFWKAGRRGANVTLSCADWMTICGLASLGVKEIEKKWRKQKLSRVELACNVAERKRPVDLLHDLLNKNQTFRRYWLLYRASVGGGGGEEGES
jgi:hypothetical protein